MRACGKTLKFPHLIEEFMPAVKNVTWLTTITYGQIGPLSRSVKPRMKNWMN